MKNRYYIRATNNKGKVTFFDIDRSSGGYPYMCSYGYGKSFGSFEEALEVMNKEFFHQNENETYPNTLLHSAVELSNENISGSAVVEIIEMVPQVVAESQKEFQVCIRPEVDRKLRREEALAKLSLEDRKVLGL